MTQLQQKTDQLAFSVVQIKKYLLVVLKIQSCVKIAPEYKGTYKL